MNCFTSEDFPVRQRVSKHHDVYEQELTDGARAHDYNLASSQAVSASHSVHRSEKREPEARSKNKKGEVDKKNGPAF